MKLIYTSCVHVGIENVYSCGEPISNFAHFASLEPDAILLDGDITEDGSLVQTLEMDKIIRAFKHIPFWLLAGNHDACSECGDLGGCEGGSSPCSEAYANHRALLSPDLHWVRDVGNTLRFIGFDSRLIRSEPFLGFGKIESDELAWVTAAINQSVTDGKKTILCSHFPLIDVFGNNIKLGQAALLTAMSNAGNVLLYLSGHRHFWGHQATQDSTIHVSAPGLAYSGSAYDPPFSQNGGFFVITITDTQINFEMFAADDPTYTPRPAVNFSVNY